MVNEFLILMKQELVVTFIIFVLLFVKLGKEETKNETLVNFVNILLTLNLVSGLLFSAIRDFIWRYVPYKRTPDIRKKSTELRHTDHFPAIL